MERFFTDSVNQCDGTQDLGNYIEINHKIDAYICGVLTNKYFRNSYSKTESAYTQFQKDRWVENDSLSTISSFKQLKCQLLSLLECDSKDVFIQSSPPICNANDTFNLSDKIFPHPLQVQECMEILCALEKLISKRDHSYKTYKEGNLEKYNDCPFVWIILGIKNVESYEPDKNLNDFVYKVGKKIKDLKAKWSYLESYLENFDYIFSRIGSNNLLLEQQLDIETRCECYKQIREKKKGGKRNYGARRMY